jgi:hypothetical protein
LKAAGALATNHIKRATRAQLAWPKRSAGNPTPSAILRFRAGSYEWQANELKPLAVKKGFPLPNLTYF